MKITEALRIVQCVSKESPVFDAVLACGFTPLHLQTFLTARLQQNLPGRRVVLKTGLYGDTAGTLESLSGSAPQAVIIALEWGDLDPRLGYREGGTWGPGALPDVLAGSRASLQRISGAVQRLPPGARIAISTPTLPLPPVFHTSGWQAGEAELLLEQAVAEFAAGVAGHKGVAVVNARRLAEDSAPATRLDLKSDLLLGLPYTLGHADMLAASLAQLIAPPPAKKGIITDLDGSLWHGVVGEIGPQAISWDLMGHHHLHGLYQKLLSALSEQGVLIGVASKNDSEVVQRAFQRTDLLLKAERVFPIEAHWSAKSGSVERILRAWNVAADSVIFVDDSPMELAEVAAAHPGIECIEFPAGDYAAGYAMLRRLRDLCGKDQLSPDDAIRLDSIRRGADFRQMSEAGSAPESFLAQVNATVVFDFHPAVDGRVLELANKTNQFNLNGIRYTESDWQARMSQPGAMTVAVSYEDKFGPLGKIAVMQGCRQAGDLTIAAWVMSCRAFARRIEYQCLKELFQRYEVRQIAFDFAPTPKNGPLRQFFDSLLGGEPNGPFVLTRERFEGNCPALYHQVSEQERVNADG